MIFAALSEAAEKGELLLVGGGLCHFHQRKDRTVTIREILVLPTYRRRGIGRRLVERACNDAVKAVARCPADLPSNGFWKQLGFQLMKTETTRTGRKVNVWVWEK